MKKNMSSLWSLCLCAALVFLVIHVLAGTTPTPLQPTIGGGKGHYTATLARDALADISDGATVAANGVTEMEFALWAENGTVNLTPQCGYYVYESGAYVKTQWADLDTVAGAAAGTVLHYQLACDLVRIKAENCSACRFTAVWVGVVK